MPTHLEVNGQARETENEPAIPLAVYLREELGLRGTKIGCGNAECGACTVVMDGRAVCSCLVPLGRTEGRRIETMCPHRPPSVAPTDFADDVGVEQP